MQVASTAENAMPATSQARVSSIWPGGLAWLVIMEWLIKRTCNAYGVWSRHSSTCTSATGTTTCPPYARLRMPPPPKGGAHQA